MTTLTITLLILFLISNASNYTIICDQHKDPQCAQIACPLNDTNCDLHVKCMGELTDVYESCASTHINCTQAKSCIVDCTGESSCNSAHVTCPINGICNVNCKSEKDDTCVDIQIDGNKNTTTNINCGGNKACEGGTIRCDFSSECNLFCHGIETCHHLSIDGSNATRLNILNCTGGSSTCNNLRINCPQRYNDDPHCILPGNGVYNLRDEFNGIKSGGINIYAKHSWRDIIISSYNTHNKISGTMYCGYNWLQLCNITNNNNNSWNCINNEKLCLPTPEPTDNPTLEPTYNPTYYPTIDPTINPTILPTYNPTYNPSINPTIEPTNSTFNPTTYPTYEPIETTLIIQQSTSVQSSTTMFLKHLRYGMVIGVIIIIIFMCVLCCGWKYWNNGKITDKKKTNEKTIHLNDQSDESDESDTLTMGGRDISKKNKKKIDKQPIDHNQVIEIKNNNDNDNRDASNGTNKKKDKKRKKKKKKKKKKRKKKTHHESTADNAGDYQKQTDDPFQDFGTELTDFN